MKARGPTLVEKRALRDRLGSDPARSISRKIRTYSSKNDLVRAQRIRPGLAVRRGAAFPAPLSSPPGESHFS